MSRPTVPSNQFWAGGDNGVSGAGYRRIQVAPVGGKWFADREEFDIRDMDRSGDVEPAPNGDAWAAETTYYNTDDDHDPATVEYLSDEERDEDADGLTNFDETRGCMGSQEYWTKLYDKESKYYLAYSGTRLDDEDTDGDDVRDGADDADHDDLPNLMECSRTMATTLDRDPRPALGDPDPSRLTLPTVNGFVNPFNPCLPSYTSRSCNQYPSLDGGWAPFVADDEYFYVWN